MSSELFQTKCFEKAPLLQCRHGFSIRTGGISEGIFSSLNLGMNRGDSREAVTANWKIFFNAIGIPDVPFVCGKQVHGNYVHISTKKDARFAYGEGELIEADGYVTNEPGLPIAIFTADCVPILMEDTINGCVGAIHSGWRSTAADIEKSAIDKMLSIGAAAENIKIAIGPAINQCCFEVGEEVISAMDMLLNDSSLSGELYYRKADGKYMLDLKGVIKKRFLQLGIPESNICLIGKCTMCNPKLYFSHRYTHGERGSMASVIMLD